MCICSHFYWSLEKMSPQIRSLLSWDLKKSVFFKLYLKKDEKWLAMSVKALSISINFARRTLELHCIIIKGAKLFSSWENVSRIW